MTNTQCPIAVTTTVTATGTDAPTSLNYPGYITQHGGWEVVNPAGTVIAWYGRYNASDNTQGWSDVTKDTTSGNTITSFPITPPTGTPTGTGYEFKTFNANGPAASAFFDVVVPNPQIVQGTSATIVATGPGGNVYPTAWSITKSDGTAIASGTVNPGNLNGTPSNGYNISMKAGDSSSTLRTTTINITVTIPLTATIQAGDIATYTTNAPSDIHSAAFDVIAAPSTAPINLTTVVTY